MPAKPCELYEERWCQPQIENLNELMRSDSPQEILTWAHENFAPKLKFACGFDLEDVVLMHMIKHLSIEAEVFFIDTGRLPQETYDLIETYRERYQIDLKVYVPDAQQLARLLSKNGFNHFYRNVAARQECCEVRLKEPKGRALAGAEAWISGLRLKVTSASQQSEILEIDQEHGGILKINPLLHWTWKDIWNYVHSFDLPYHPLVNQGYPRIGCHPCTRAVQPGDDWKLGRWWWEKNREEQQREEDHQTNNNDQGA